VATRKKTTIRIDQEKWRAFVADLRSKHLRTCSVLEALISAYLYGGAMIPGLGRPQHVNITIQRIINVPGPAGFEPTVSDQEWDEWVKEYRERYGYRLEQVGPKRYRITPI